MRRAGVADAPEVARLLHDFNTEFSEPTPGIEPLTGRARELLANGDITAVIGGEPPCGLALIRLRPSIWTASLSAYLEELYVAPGQRRRGIGRALLEAAIGAAREAGASWMELGTSEDDKAAMALYESCGFTNREGSVDGPRMYLYEREL